MGLRKSSSELAAKAERTRGKADKALERGHVVKSAELGVKAIRLDDKAERRAGRDPL